MGDAAGKLRIDKWLWQARFFKTRSLAARQVAGGHVRVNGTRASKPAQTVAPGDVLTFAQGRIIRVVRIEALGLRRGPAPEAQTLYCDLTPAAAEDPDRVGARAPGQGRPEKRERRALDRLRRSGPD